jgi:co-chaperonin GroES (HSP10)
MKAIGRNLVVKIAKTGISKTQGGLLLGEKQREDIRYAEGTVVTAGADAGGLKENDVIYFDKNNSHQIEVKDEIYNVVKVDNVVIVL